MFIRKWQSAFAFALRGLENEQQKRLEELTTSCKIMPEFDSGHCKCLKEMHAAVALDCGSSFLFQPNTTELAALCEEVYDALFGKERGILAREHKCRGAGLSPPLCLTAGWLSRGAGATCR